MIPSSQSYCCQTLILLFSHNNHNLSCLKLTSLFFFFMDQINYSLIVTCQRIEACLGLNMLNKPIKRLF